MKQRAQAFRSFYWNFLQFLGSQSKYIAFIAIYYALWFVIDRISYFKFDLKSFDQRPIGMATFDGYDIGARVSLYYSCVIIFFSVFLIIGLLGYFIQKKNNNLLRSAEVRMLNYSSLAGITLLVFLIFDIRIFETLEILYFVQKFVVFGLILKIFFRKTTLNIYHYVTILSISVGLFFFVADINNLLGYSLNPDLYIVSFIIACVLLLLLQIFLRSGKIGPAGISRIAYVLVPLSLLPFFSSLKDELFFIFKANNIVLSSQASIYLVLILVLAGFVFLRSRKKTIPNLKDSLSKGYFPLLIFSLVTYTFYSYYAEYYDELFESGNVYLPLMEHKLFGLIPTLEKLNTHLISDYFLNAIYATLNGLNMHEIVLYEFFILTFSYLLFYYVIYYITKNEFLAFFFMFFFPYAEILAPAGFFMGVLGIFALQKVCLNKSSLKNYIVFALILFILIIWRIDLAFTCVVAIPASLLFFHLRDKAFSINWRYLLTSLCIVFFSTLLIVVALSLYRSVNFFSKISYFINYSMSAQSYGLKMMGWSTTPTYKMQYFVFPAITALVSVFLILKYEALSKRYKLAYLTMIYICIFYFVSFNRGIIRHSLLEWMDSFTSTFVYIIIPGSLYFILRKQSQALKFILFVGIVFIMGNNYRLPEPKNIKSPSELLIEKLKNSKNINLSTVKSRVLKAAEGGKVERDEFVSFIKTNTREDETFIDFSNRPMYHFFTQKETPAWFYQNPLCIRNDFLQEKFIEDLSHYKTPYLLFNGLNDQLYDGVDQVSNTLRHYRMAEYFYTHYKPYVILDGLCLWRANTVEDLNKIDTVYTFRKWPKPLVNPSKIITRVAFDSTKKYLVKITFDRNPQYVEVKAFSPNKTFTTSVRYVNDTTYYCILKLAGMKGNSFYLQCANNEALVSNVSLLECKYIPDFTVEKYQYYTIRRLPYIWGTYDKLLPEEKVLFDGSSQITEKDALPPIIRFPEDLDKSSGNTFVMYCTNTTKNVQRLNLSFGPATGHLYTTTEFEVVPSERPQKYAIRVSSNYKWYSEKNCRAFIWASSGDPTGLKITGVKITKGK